MHLDSVLSKQPREYKDALAKILSLILRKPHSIAQALSLPVVLPPRLPLRLATDLYERIQKGELLPEPDAAREDYPEAWLKACEEEWGSVVTQRLVQVLARAPRQGLRSVQMHPHAPSFSFAVDPSPLSPWGWITRAHQSVFKEEEYLNGKIEIQDEGSQVIAATVLWPEVFAPLWQSTPTSSASLTWSDELRVRLKPPRDALRVVDVCAGAGGKSLALASYLQGRGRVFAYDPYEKKLAALRKRAQRAELRNIQTVQVRMGQDDERVDKFAEQADLVLVDAPCSGWGVLRRSPDIKWREDLSALDRLPVLQSEILNSAARLVRPGGSLLYSLCTFRKKESSDVVDAFSLHHPEFQLTQGGYLGPGISDGFFLQRWVKTGLK